MAIGTGLKKIITEILVDCNVKVVVNFCRN